MDDYCEVTFEGDQGGTYYVACPLVAYLSDELVNTSNNTINFYSAPQQGTNQAVLSAPAFSYPRYTYNNQYRYITNAHNVSFNNRSNFYRHFDQLEVYLFTTLVIVSLIRLMMHRGK